MANPIKRVLIFVSGLAFLSSMGFMAASVLSNNNTTTPNSEQSGQEEGDRELLARESGYVAVLDREPDNVLALQGLIQTRLALQKWQEVIEPLETLAKKSPDNPEIWQALAAVHIQLQDYKGAIAPMEKLSELTPENEELKEQLEKLKQQVTQNQKNKPNE
ncbi:MULTISPECIES: tetratricopeptide repeat protein [Spirulina sp. CCY15215]|uniref:tetratricopeptide repeat protein n=1 Tax=Spirulina sp. CCY15215 TaxID=2767591 RepID=UPI00195226A0|nr:tetratricopeptide repeat protein [Spirulina major]